MAGPRSAQGGRHHGALAGSLAEKPIPAICVSALEAGTSVSFSERIDPLVRLRTFLPFLLMAVVGSIAFAILLPQFRAPLPHVATITRDRALEIANAEARSYGIPVEQAWPLVTWETQPMLEQLFEEDPALRRRAAADPVIGPRISSWRVTYFRKAQEKFPAYGFVLVTPTGEITGVRKTLRSEERRPEGDAAQLRADSDAFVEQNEFAGAPSREFQSMRESSLAGGRVDRVFRYEVPSAIDTEGVSTLLAVFYSGSERVGWMLLEEYADGSQFRGDATSEATSAFTSFVSIFLLLVVLLTIFLRKYHAGEVGVGIGAVLFLVTVGLGLIFNFITSPESSFGAGFGGASAQMTATILAGFRALFLDIPLAVVVFVGWAVGESFARERWGERLASFDALVRRDPLNATVGTSLINGVLAAPAVAAGTLASGALGIMLAGARPTLGPDLLLVLSTRGGAIAAVLASVLSSLIFAVPGLLFLLAYFHRRRMVGVGVLLAIVLAIVLGTLHPPISPIADRYLFAWGGVAVAIAVFLLGDLLAAGVAVTVGTLILIFVPYLTFARGDAAVQGWLGLLIPTGIALLLGIGGLLTRREVSYSYEDLAPHVRRIIERERIKAEIDAANRIQGALLPAVEPTLDGAIVASHYRAASEIGGDYFDFLPLPEGRMGVAFGDVAGHGLTSGIIMAMAKSALLVQIGYDSRPRVVMQVLNDTVMKTAPRRMLMTFFYGLLDPASQSMTFSSAGHLDPYVWRAREKRLEALSSWGFPLGVRRREGFAEHDVEFEAGDRLILYSDGFIEAVDDDGEPFGFDRFEQVIRTSGARSAEEIRRALLEAVKKFTRNRPPEDDQTLVVIAFESLAGAQMTA